MNHPTLTPTYPVLRPDRTGKQRWYLDQPVKFTTGPMVPRYLAGSGKFEMTIPKGYVFDGHSVPLIFQMAFKPGGRDIYAALVHDYLYEYAKTLQINRAFADRAYRALMRDPAYIVSPFRAWLFSAAVRVFGWLYFYPGRK